MKDIQGITVGSLIEDTQQVTPERVASHLGSGSLHVYATPAMVAFVEQTCRKLVEPHLPEGMTTVGIALTVHHTAPTPLGRKVSIKAEIVLIEKNVISFQTELWDEVEKIGEAAHKRAVIEIDRFNARVHKKSF
ncbi:MAG: thioesterase family protein [Anaerolineales bacterium]|nr:thioesterase family protein [Anaerolineales bacterium]HUS84413.1 thioesterase family protein [Anaerolineales bacterium]